MRPFFLIILIALGAAASGLRAEPQIAPRAPCKYLDTPVILFDASESEPKQSLGYFRWIVRTARKCRFNRLSIVIFGDKDDRLSQLRADDAERDLSTAHWPADSIQIEFQSGSAPSGTDLGKNWAAGAEIHFIDPDPSWVPPLKQLTEVCSGPGRKCEQIPWPQPRRTAQEPPPPTFDPPVLFFDPGSADLNREARLVLPTAITMQHDLNFRDLFVTGYADKSESDPDDLSFRRALAVRKELVRLGIPPPMIVVRGGGTGPSPFGDDPRFSARVAIDFGD